MAALSPTASGRSSPGCLDWVLFLPSSRRFDARVGRQATLNRSKSAFGAIAIAVAKDLGLSEDIVNVEGRAIAHSHPIGATGAVLTTRLLHSMQRDGLKRGVVTLCIGGGQGIALALETIR
jgi:acetyl-CoA acetyltransferase